MKLEEQTGGNELQQNWEGNYKKGVLIDPRNKVWNWFYVLNNKRLTVLI